MPNRTAVLAVSFALSALLAGSGGCQGGGAKAQGGSPGTATAGGGANTSGAGAGSGTATADPRSNAALRKSLSSAMPHLGQGNWIIVADAAFPKSTHPGWKTVPVNVPEAETLAAVLDTVKATGHLSPLIHLPDEQARIPEADAPGMQAFRAQVASLTSGLKVEQDRRQSALIQAAEEAGRKHRVLILKCPTKLPYGSVFIQLSSSYWTPEQEARLRNGQPGAGSQ